MFRNIPQLLAAVVMLCDTLSHESVVLGHHRAGPAHPPYSSCASHLVANYRCCYSYSYSLDPPPPPQCLLTHSLTHSLPPSDLEDQWQGKSALPLLGDRLQQPMAGACLLSLGQQREEEERVAAITVG